MKVLFIFFLILFSPGLMAQYGIKAGPNFAKVSNAKSINGDTRSGFHAGILLAPTSKKIMSSRTELIFSRQGYNYKTASNSGEVNLDYIQFGQMLSLNFTKYISVLLGAQTAYLISAQVDSNANTGTNNPQAGIMKLYNRFDYGYSLGAELHPLKGLLIGARYNVSLNKLYESFQTGQQPSFSSQDAKNNVLQIYVGWRFNKSKRPSS